MAIPKKYEYLVIVNGNEYRMSAFGLYEILDTISSVDCTAYKVYLGDKLIREWSRK